MATWDAGSIVSVESDSGVEMWIRRYFMLSVREVIFISDCYSKDDHYTSI